MKKLILVFALTISSFLYVQKPLYAVDGDTHDLHIVRMMNMQGGRASANCDIKGNDCTMENIEAWNSGN